MLSILLRVTALFCFLFSLHPLTTSWAETEKKSKFSVPEQRVLYAAQQAMDKADYPQVIEVLSTYLKEHPETKPALFFLFLGHACSQQKNIPAATKWFQAGFRKNPDNIFLCRNLAILHYQQKHFIQSGQLFQRGYEISKPPDPALLYQAAIAFYQAKKLNLALKVLEQLFETAASLRREWYLLMIQVCYEKHDLQRSTKYLEAFLEIYPGERNYWKILAGIWLEQEKYTKAATALRTALMTGNATSQEWKELASLYFYMNAPLQGVRCLEKTLGTSSPPQKYDALARGYLLAHRTDKGLHYLDAAIAQQPTPQRLMMKAKALMASRRFSDAIATLKKFLELKPKNQDEAWLLMAYCAVEKEEWKQAETWLHRVKDKKFKEYATSVLRAIAPLLEEMPSE